MKSIKAVLLSVVLVCFSGTALAQTCFDPHVGYFQCGPVNYVRTCYDPNYGYYNCGGGSVRTSYHSNSGESFVIGAMAGLLVGGALMQNQGHWHGHHGWHRW